LTFNPFQVLAILLEHPGDVVAQDEFQKRLWPDTFVDVDHNLNTAINKIREVLGDSAESPRIIETLPRRGYRFITPVDAGASVVPAQQGKAHQLATSVAFPISTPRFDKGRPVSCRFSANIPSCPPSQLKLAASRSGASYLFLPES